MFPCNCTLEVIQHAHRHKEVSGVQNTMSCLTSKEGSELSYHCNLFVKQVEICNLEFQKMCILGIALSATITFPDKFTQIP